jgi:hypothetical protein
MPNPIAKFLLSLSAFLLPALWVYVMVAVYQKLPLPAILLGIVVVTAVFLLLSFLFASILWAATYMLVGKQTRETLRHFFVCCAFGVAIVGSLNGSWALYHMGAMDKLFNPIDFGQLNLLFAPYFFILWGFSLYFSGPKTDEVRDS